MKICLYPGTFDPFTNGHLDVLARASKLFDRIIVAVLNNSAKKPFFSVCERMKFIELAGKSMDIENFEADCFEGLTVDFARERGACAILRGLRAVTDFEYELQIAAMNKRLAPELDGVFLMTSAQYSFLSSSIVKEIASLGGDISGLVPAEYANMIVERLNSK